MLRYVGAHVCIYAHTALNKDDNKEPLSERAGKESLDHRSQWKTKIHQ